MEEEIWVLFMAQHSNLGRVSSGQTTLDYLGQAEEWLGAKHAPGCTLLARESRTRFSKESGRGKVVEQSAGWLGEGSGRRRVSLIIISFALDPDLPLFAPLPF